MRSAAIAGRPPSRRPALTITAGHCMRARLANLALMAQVLFEEGDVARAEALNDESPPSAPPAQVGDGADAQHVRESGGGARRPPHCPQAAGGV